MEEQSAAGPDLGGIVTAPRLFAGLRIDGLNARRRMEMKSIASIAAETTARENDLFFPGARPC